MFDFLSSGSKIGAPSASSCCYPAHRPSSHAMHSRHPSAPERRTPPPAPCSPSAAATHSRSKPPSLGAPRGAAAHPAPVPVTNRPPPSPLAFNSGQHRTSPPPMASPNGDHEDRANEDDHNIPPIAPSFEHKMLECMAAQTQILQAMAQSMVNIHQYITEQASLPRNHSTITNDNHPISSAPLLPPFDKEKLLAMLAQVLQGRMQSNMSTPHKLEMNRAGLFTGPVKRQVAEAWNNQRNKKRHKAQKLLVEEQHEVIKTLGTCQCCEHHGLPCPKKEASLMTAEAKQLYHVDINKKRMLSTQDPIPEGVSQAEDSPETINLKDWSISFKEYQPGRSKQNKKPTSDASQQKMELTQPLAHSCTLPSSNQPQFKLVQPPHDNSIKKNSYAQAIPPRVMVEQKGIQHECTKRLCFGCGEEGHYVNKCPTKRKLTRSRDAGLFCLKCGKDEHLASWCEKEDDSR